MMGGGGIHALFIEKEGGVDAQEYLCVCVTRHTSHDTRHTSHVTRRTSHVTRHTTHVTRHTSHVIHHTSHVTRHLPRRAEFYSD